MKKSQENNALYGTVCFCIQAFTRITIPPSDCSPHKNPRAPQRGRYGAWLLFLFFAARLALSRRPLCGVAVGRLRLRATAHALPLATRDGRGHPPTHTCSLWPPNAQELSVAPTPMQGRSGRCACPHYLRTTCPHYMPASRSSMGAWCVSSVFVCQAVMWRHAMPLEHGVSREHVRGGRGAWDPPWSMGSTP